MSPLLSALRVGVARQQILSDLALSHIVSSHGGNQVRGEQTSQGPSRPKAVARLPAWKPNEDVADWRGPRAGAASAKGARHVRPPGVHQEGKPAVPCVSFFFLFCFFFFSFFLFSVAAVCVGVGRSPLMTCRAFQVWPLEGPTGCARGAQKVARGTPGARGRRVRGRRRRRWRTRRIAGPGAREDRALCPHRRRPCWAVHHRQSAVGLQGQVDEHPHIPRAVFGESVHLHRRTTLCND